MVYSAGRFASIPLPWHRGRGINTLGTRGALRLMWLAVLGLGLAGCGGGSVRACFGDDEFCDRVFARNQPPIADAGADQTVGAGDQITLDGSASRDPDGTIATYSWTQQEGPVVAIADSTRAVARFVAPEVTVETSLRFRLVVTDNRGASDSDTVEVTVVPSVSLALQHGVALLMAMQDPLVRSVELTCEDCAPRLGLWLGARALAAEAAAETGAETGAGTEASIDDLLDAVRVITQLDSERLGQAPLTPEAHRLFELGHAQLAHFATWRDPATAERARALAGATSEIDTEHWQAALLAAEPTLAHRVNGNPAALSSWLRRGAADASTTEIAAAVIVLAQTAAAR